MEGQSPLLVLVSSRLPSMRPRGHGAPCWERVVHFLPPGRHSVAEEDSAQSSARSLRVWPLMACHLLNSVRTKELILAVTGLWGGAQA